jgi:hypothetical protein
LAQFGILIQVPAPQDAIVSGQRNKIKRADFFNRILACPDRQFSVPNVLTTGNRGNFVEAIDHYEITAVRLPQQAGGADELEAVRFAELFHQPSFADTRVAKNDDWLLKSRDYLLITHCLIF